MNLRSAAIASVSIASHAFVALAAQTPTAAPPSAAAPRATIEVRVDPRVELMSVLFRLAGNPEYNQAASGPYTRAVAQRFASFKDHAAVKLARRLREKSGIGFDAVMKLAMHVEDVESLGERIPFDRNPPGLVSRWKADDARELLEAARDFVDESNFAGFCDENAQLYAQAADRLRETLGRRDYLAWLERFFGERPRARFFAVPGLLNGGANYSVTVTFPDGAQEIHVVLGAEATDGAGIPTFGESVFPTAAHEFCHAFVNPFVDRHGERLDRSGEQLFQWTRGAMLAQAYGNGHTLLDESLVRACVVRFVAETGGPEAAEREIAEQVGRRFLWTRELADLLATYESSREKAPTLDAFADELGAFFDEQARADSPRALAIGPIDEALREFQKKGRMVLVAPARSTDAGELELATDVGKVHAQFYANDSIPLARADDPSLDDAELATKALVLYGTPSDHPLVKRVLEARKIEWSEGALTVGGREFRGRDLVLITVLPSPWNRALPVVLYAARAPQDLIGVNRFRHGGTDVVVGEWDAQRQPRVLVELNFERRADGSFWLGESGRQ